MLGWRDVPSDNRTLGEIARSAEPVIRQVFVGGNGLVDEELERRLYRVRKRAERRARVELGITPDAFYIPSMSCKTICYKGMFLAPQLFAYYPDLADPDMIDGAGGGPPALQHEHLPELAAGPTLPHDRPQRRDQYAPRQLEPPDGLREADDLPGFGQGPHEALSDRRAGRERLGLLRQLHGAAGPRGPLRAARLDDDDSRGVRPGAITSRWTSRPSTSITGRSSSRGTVRRRCSSPTAGWWAARWTATACGPAATSSPPRALSCWPARWA